MYLKAPATPPLAFAGTHPLPSIVAVRPCELRACMASRKRSAQALATLLNLAVQVNSQSFMASMVGVAVEVPCT